MISDHIIKRKLSISIGEVVKEIEQVHYMGWPDHGIPKSPETIEAFETVLQDSIDNA